MKCCRMKNLEKLEMFYDRIKKYDSKSEYNFSEIVSTAQSLLGITDQELADTFSVSRSTVYRWATCSSMPCLAVRDSFLKWLSMNIQHRLNSRSTEKSP